MVAKPGTQQTGNGAGKVIGQSMVFLKHARLAVLLLILALAGGLAYYVYAKPVYYAKSLVKYNIVNLPVHSESAGQDTPHYRLQRALLTDLQSRHLIERTAVRLGLVKTTGSFETIREEFVKAVTVERLDAFKLKIVVQPYSAEIAEVWAEAMVEEYLDYQAELRMEYSEQAVEAYTRELAQIREKLLSSLEDRLAFENKSEFAERSLEAAEYNRLLADLFVIRQQIRSAERAEEAISSSSLSPLDMIARLARFNSEIKSSFEPTISASEPSRGPVKVTPHKGETILMETGAASAAQWESLQGKKDELEAQLEEYSKTLLPGNSKMKEISTKLSLLNKQIELEAEAAVNNFRNQFAQMKETERSLDEKRPAGREAVAKLSKKQLEFEMLKGQLPWEKAYADIQKKLESLDFGAGKERVLLHHEQLEQVRRTPTSPNKLKLVYAALALGLALAFGVPIGLEHFNDTASKIDDLERDLNLKGLGIVPVTPVGDLEDIVRSPEVDARIPNSLLENFRVIRSGIALNGDPSQQSQVIMLTSARPSEGKTVNSCNLGWAFASINEPTLLIDSDLRRGRVHNVLDIPNEVGLSSVVMGKATIEEAIQPTRVPNLWALTRGPIIPGSTEQLCIPEHERRLQDLRLRFDRIIMDTPPVLGLSETSSLMRLVDGVVLIIRAERTTHRDINAAATILRKAGAKFYGFVLNRLDLNRISNYYNYYYYSSYYYDELVESEREQLQREQEHRQQRRRQPRND
jgi:capsular exopolysaccharide synthesis family protein